MAGQPLGRVGKSKSKGYRSIVLYRKGDKAFFVYGFSKSDVGNIREDEQEQFKKAAKSILASSHDQIRQLIENGQLARPPNRKTTVYMYDLIKALSLLIYPLGAFFVLAATALALRLLARPKRSLTTAFMALSWLWIWSMPVTSEHLRASLESHYDYLPVEEVPTADAIVVLGGAFSSDPAWPYPSAGGSIDRYWHGARLYHAGRAPKIILSGGRHPERPNNLSEAESGALFLMDMGVPSEALLLDNLSRTTHDHIRYLQPMLAEAGIERLLMVTSATHMRRAEAVFRHAGLDIIPVATGFSVSSDPVITLRRYLPSVSGLSGSTRAVHEIVGCWFYRLRGWA